MTRHSMLHPEVGCASIRSCTTLTLLRDLNRACVSSFISTLRLRTFSHETCPRRAVPAGGAVGGTKMIGSQKSSRVALFRNAAPKCIGCRIVTVDWWASFSVGSSCSLFTPRGPFFHRLNTRRKPPIKVSRHWEDPVTAHALLDATSGRLCKRPLPGQSPPYRLPSHPLS